MVITFVTKDKVKYTKAYITDCDKESSYRFCWRMLDVDVRCRFILAYVWTVTCDFQQCGILTSVDSNKPVKIRNSKWCLGSSLTLQLAKALIRLRVCAGWSEPLLVKHTKLLESSCHGSYCRWQGRFGRFWLNALIFGSQINVKL